MTLGDYLTSKRMSAADFAAVIDVHRSTVSRWLERPVPGETVFRPSWEQLAKIRDATAGEVTANDFLDAADADHGDPPGEAAA